MIESLNKHSYFRFSHGLQLIFSQWVVVLVLAPVTDRQTSMHMSPLCTSKDGLKMRWGNSACITDIIMRRIPFTHHLTTKIIMFHQVVTSTVNHRWNNTSLCASQLKDSHSSLDILNQPSLAICELVCDKDMSSLESCQ